MERGLKTSRVRLPWIVAIGVISAANLLFPRSFLFFGVDSLSFLPVGFQIAWTVLALAAGLCMPLPDRAGLVPKAGAGRRKRLAEAWPWAFALVMIVSLPVFRATLPGIHGDGESGGYPAGGVARLALYPAADGRLQSFLNIGLSRIVPETLRFRYNFNALFQDFPLNSSWILLTLLCGAVLILLATVVVSRWRVSAGCRVGLLVTVLASPPMLNAYGHFDSYIVPVLCIFLWFGALVLVRVSPRRLLSWTALALTLLAGAWAHPILMVLWVYTGILAIALVLQRIGHRVPVAAAVAAGVAAGLLPYAIGRGNMDYFRAENLPLLGWILHEKAMSCCCAVFPAVLLGALAVWDRRRELRAVSAFQALPLVLLISGMMLCFSLWVGYGVRDEFLYSMFGAICLAGAVLLFITIDAPGHLLLGSAVLSLCLFVPKVWVYSGPRLHHCFVQRMLHDRCSAARIFSAYYLIAAATPVDTPEYRARKLALLREGALWPAAKWGQPHYRKMNRAHYAAWCMEFGEDREAAEHLEWFLLHATDVLPHFWRGNGRAFRTDHFLNTSPERARAITRNLLAKYARTMDGNEALAALWTALERADETDPVVRYAPRPGTREADVRERMGEFWPAHAPAITPLLAP